MRHSYDLRSLMFRVGRRQDSLPRVRKRDAIGSTRNSLSNPCRSVIRGIPRWCRVAHNDRSWDNGRRAETALVLRPSRRWWLRTRIVRNVVEPRVRRNGSDNLEGYPLRFTENGDEDKRCENSAL